MQRMQNRMQAMHETMAKIRATKDPAERQRLMQEHVQAMHSGMAMMDGMGGSAGRQGDAAARCGEGDLACRMNQMQTQHGAMAERMGMMQQMMQQMMDHMMQREAAPPASPEPQEPRGEQQNREAHH